MTRSTMGRRRLLTTAVAAVAVVAGLATGAPATAATGTTGPGVYDFPVRPGTAEWAALRTHDDMVRVTQLPPGMAAEMSTAALVDTVLDYPLLLDALAFNSVQEGFETVASRFDGLTELLARPDAGSVLLRRYQAFDARVPAKADELAAGNHTHAAWKLETLLAQPKVLATLTADQQAALLREGLATYDAKRADAAVYGVAGLEPTTTLLGRALALREGWSYDGSMLLRDGIAPAAAAVEEIPALVRAHFSQPGVQHRAGTQDYYSTVYTPNGSPVSVITMTYELTSAQITANNNWTSSNYPSATREASSSRKYNCHSYAWYSTSTANDRWMNTPGDDQYWLDGSYTQWRIPYIYFANMRWNWPNGDHSGIEVNTSSYIRSKWGQLGRMYHYYSYSPYNASALYQYFR